MAKTFILSIYFHLVSGSAVGERQIEAMDGEGVDGFAAFVFEGFQRRLDGRLSWERGSLIHGKQWALIQFKSRQFLT